MPSKLLPKCSGKCFFLSIVLLTACLLMSLFSTSSMSSLAGYDRIFGRRTSTVSHEFHQRLPDIPTDKSFEEHPNGGVQIIQNRSVENATTGKSPDVAPQSESPPLASSPPQRSGGGDENSIVFIKTHKTGSSTVSSILQRYGYTHNLTFLVPRIGTLINYSDRFNASKVDTKWRQTNGFRLLTNHARYDRHEMSSVFPNATYITIIRDPVYQLESAFYYFDIPETLPPESKGNDPLEYFLKNPMKNYVELMSKDHYVKHCMHNHQLFDLGVDVEEMYRPEVSDEKISELDQYFDLVMVCEYFDESLLLLKRMLHWTLDDVVYIMRGSRATKYRHGETSEELRKRIRAWNAGDSRLYDHFNMTLWSKIQAYGPSFEADLQTLREKISNASEICLVKNKQKTFSREDVPTLRKGAPNWCKDLQRSIYDFTELIRGKMKRAGVPLYSITEKFPRRKSSNVKKPVRTIVRKPKL